MLDSEFFPTPPKTISLLLAGIDQAERAAVDAFEGQLTYAKVMADPAKYIIEPAGMLQLAEKEVG